MSRNRSAENPQTIEERKRGRPLGDVSQFAEMFVNKKGEPLDTKHFLDEATKKFIRNYIIKKFKSDIMYQELFECYKKFCENSVRLNPGLKTNLMRQALCVNPLCLGMIYRELLNDENLVEKLEKVLKMKYNGSQGKHKKTYFLLLLYEITENCYEGVNTLKNSMSKNKEFNENKSLENSLSSAEGLESPSNNETKVLSQKSDAEIYYPDYFKGEKNHFDNISSSNENYETQNEKPALNILGTWEEDYNSLEPIDKENTNYIENMNIYSNMNYIFMVNFICKEGEKKKTTAYHPSNPLICENLIYLS